MLPVLIITPFSLIALFLIWLLVRLIADIGFWWFALGYLVASLALFVRPIQLAVLPRLLGARVPNSAEESVIRPLWNSVTQANGLPRGH